MDRGLTFFTLALLLVWLVFDDLFGEKKYLSKLAQAMTPNLPTLGDMGQAVFDTATDSVKKTVTDTRKAQKEADKKAGDIIWDPLIKNEKDPKKKEKLEEIKDKLNKKKDVSPYKDKGTWGYSWEDLFNDIAGWFK
ncbi:MULTISPECIES: cytoplasmic protein [Bacillus]|uniref:cytoplasmic protein n=1 Tax=Bacillus TaxID=1386 RepID=UPI0021B2CCFB|nr:MULTISPECIES: cytoplasmic protein [Bacillus]